MAAQIPVAPAPRRLRLFRRCALVAVLVAILSACAGPMLVPPPAPPPPRQRYLVAGINSIRAGRAVAPVAPDPALNASARRWAGVLAMEGRLRHSDLTHLPLPFSIAGENVAVAGDVAQAHQALVASPSHFANIVNRSYTKAGTATVRVGNRVFVVEQFCRC